MGVFEGLSLVGVRVLLGGLGGVWGWAAIGWVFGVVLLEGAVAAPAIAQRSAQQINQKQNGICLAQMAGQMDAIANRSEFRRMRWGILVRSLEGGETLYEREGDRLFIPASNAKLLTTAAVLVQLGASFRIRTVVERVTDAEGVMLRVVGRGDPSLTTVQLQDLARQVRERQVRERIEARGASSSVQNADRLVADDRYFQGDPINPNWEWEDIQAGYGAPVNSLILNRNEIVVNLVPQGLGQPLRVDWQNPADGEQWQVENTARTVAATAPEFIQVGRNPAGTILRVSGQLRVGADPEDASISVPNPTQNFLYHFRRTLVEAGANVLPIVSRAISEKSKFNRGAIAPTPLLPHQSDSPFHHFIQEIKQPINSLSNTPEFNIKQQTTLSPNSSEIAAIFSPPLSELLREANANSDNIYAEALLRILGESTRPLATSSARPLAPSPSSLQLGLSAIATTLQTRLNISPDTFALADGSGLSRKNLVSPAALVETLRAMHHQPSHHLARVYRESLAIAGVSGTLRNRFRDTPVQGNLWGKTGAISGIAALSGYLDPPQAPPLAFSILVNHFDQPVRTVRPAIDEMVIVLSRLQNCQ